MRNFSNSKRIAIKIGTNTLNRTPHYSDITFVGWFGLLRHEYYFVFLTM